MKKIRIFLASSAELEHDKELFDLFISRKNRDLFHKRIFFELVTWKDFISSMPEGGSRSQDQYNKYIRSSDITVFLFHTKLGRYTREEFDHAHDAFLKCKSRLKTPRIYTYFKTNCNEPQDLSEFRKHVDNLDHFYDTYDTMDDLFVKFNRQIDKMEQEGLVVKPEHIDVPKIIKYTVYYFLLPLLVLGGSFTAMYYFQSVNLTVQLKENQPVPALPFKKGSISLTYGDKTETLEIHDEVMFKQIPSKFKHRKMKIIFSANGYKTIDTLITLKDILVLYIQRNNSLATVFGSVQDENGYPVKDVAISISSLSVSTDENGIFRIDIPLSKQAETIELTASKSGYQKRKLTGVPSQTQGWEIVLKR